MKEQTILEMKNKIETLGQVTTGLMNENAHLTELAIGTLETIKLMDGYREAIEKLKVKMAETAVKAKELDEQGKKLDL